MSKWSSCSKWDKRYMSLAQLVSTWSKDPSTKVGAVIADKNHRQVSLGFNGYPRHVLDNDLNNRKLKYEKIIHAETNAILFADSKRLEGSTIYVYPMPPCSRCMANIIQVGISRVVVIEPIEEQKERWGESYSIGLDMAQQSKVGIIIQFLSINEEGF